MRINKKKRIAIIAGYFAGENYGLLGPQMAGTIIQENTPYDCIVVAVAREDDRTSLKKGLAEYFGKERPVIGFSTLAGRPDLLDLARELREEGAFTILAGPQADVDYAGETGWEQHEHRFSGLSDHFSLALHGPAEQAIELLEDLDLAEERDIPGLLRRRPEGDLIQKPRKPWNEAFLSKVDWTNLYRVECGGIRLHRIGSGQVLQQIGCPYAARSRPVDLDFPASLAGDGPDKVSLRLKGCSFCDVAADKGFYGSLGMETVLAQIESLPETADGRKIPFELINENALYGLPRLMAKIRERRIRPARIDLTLRADWFLKGERWVKESLVMAGSMGTRILLSSVGFESFDDTILNNLNKGVGVGVNLRAIQLMRRLKEEFSERWHYSTAAGATHGFIHPTPWDTGKTWANIQGAIDRHSLHSDILPRHSIPLIIHHASGLGEWMREVEKRKECRFGRLGSIIEWWELKRP